MGKPQRVLTDPDDPRSISQQVTENTRVIDGQVSFGNPQNPDGVDLTTLPGAAAANHPGTIENMAGSWAEANVSDLNSPIMFYHNLGVPVTTLAATNRPNVRWLHFMWQHTGTSKIPSTAAPGDTNWRLLRSTTVVGGAVSTITFTGLDGNTEKMYRITHEFVKVGASTFTMHMQPNAATTTYVRQLLVANGATVAAASSGVAGFHVATAVGGAAGEKLAGDTLFFADTDGQYRIAHSRSNHIQSNMAFLLTSGHWTNTTSNVTSLKFTNSLGTAQFGNGTKIEIWAPQKRGSGTTGLTADSTLSYCYDTRDEALITENAFPLRFYATGNRNVSLVAAVKVSFFFIPAVR